MDNQRNRAILGSFALLTEVV